MSITKIQKKTGFSYRAEVYITGERFTKVFDRKSDAVIWQAEKKTEKIPSEDSCLEKSNTTFKDFSEIWLNQWAIPNKAESTVIKDRGLLKKHIIPFFGCFYLKDISAEKIEKYKAKKQFEKILSGKSINHHIELLKKIFNDAFKWGYLKSNPLSLINKLKVSDKPYHYWSEEEGNKFLNYTSFNSKYHNIYLLALNSGMRRGEILGLPWRNVNFRSGLITVAQIYCNHTKKIIETTKSKKIRHVPMNDILVKMFSELFKKKKPEQELVFVNENGKPIDADHLIKRYFKIEVIKAGVKPIKFHDLRHTYASHYMMNGGNIYTLKEILGHSSIEVTQKYSHLSLEHLKMSSGIVRFGNFLIEDDAEKGKIICVA